MGKNKAKGTRKPQVCKQHQSCLGYLGRRAPEAGSFLYHVDRGAESQQMGIKEQLRPIRSHEVPNLSFIGINPNLTPIAKREKKRKARYTFPTSQPGVLPCRLLSAMNRSDSLPNEIGRACRVCRSQADPPVIWLAHRGNRKVLVISRLTIFLSGALKIIPHDPEATSSQWCNYATVPLLGSKHRCTSGVRELTQNSAATKMENDISHCPCQGTPRALGQSELSPLKSTWRVSFISSYYPDGLNVLFWVINVYIELKFLNSKKGHRESLGILIPIYSASPSLTGDFPQNYFILSTKQNKATSLIGSLTEPGDFLLSQLRLLQRRNIVFTGNHRVVRVRNSGRRVGTEKQWSSLPKSPRCSE